MTYRSKITWIFLLGFSLDLMNMFVATIAYPDIGHELQASVTQLAWISNAYVLGLTLVIPFCVWLATAIGERRLIAASLLIFGSASVLVGHAGSIETLIGWRLLQGLGGGLLIPVGQALAYRQFAPAQRSLLTAKMMSVALLIPALSPTLGGWVVESVSWRWIFYANLPLALLAWSLTLLWLKPDIPSSTRPSLDLGGLVGMVAYPMLRVAMLVYLFIPGVFIGTGLIAIFYLRELGFSAIHTGALMLPWALASALAIVLSKKLLSRCGPKPLLLTGMVLQGLGIGLLIPVDSSRTLLLIGAYVLMGLGSTLCSSTAQTLAFLEIPSARMGHGSALWSINRQLSFCLGAAVLSAVLSVSGSFHLTLAFAMALTLFPLLSILQLNTASVLALTLPATETT